MKKRIVDAKDDQLLLVLSEDARKRKTLLTLLGWPSSTMDRRLRKMMRYNWVKSSDYGYYALSAEGRRRVAHFSLPDLTPPLNVANLETLGRMLPSEAHQAFFRLLLSGIVSKHLLLEHHDSPWPAFFMVGQTKAFKTALAKVICEVLGLDPTIHVRPMHTATAGELGIRREPQKGVDRYSAKGSDLYDLPFICLDELDKASDPKVRRNAEFFMQGEREFSAEGKKITNHACPLVIANPKQPGEFPLLDPYLRRSVILHTDGVAENLQDVDLNARQIFAWLDKQQTPMIEMSKLAAQHTELSDAKFLLMRGWYFDHVLDAHRTMVDAPPLALLVLGRMALLPEQSIDDAVFHTVYDRLICLETEAQTIPDWRQSLTLLWAEHKGDEDPELLQKLQTAKQKVQHRKQLIHEAENSARLEEKEQLHDEVHLTRVRLDAVAEIEAAHARLMVFTGRYFKSQTKSLRAQLNLIKNKVEKAKTEHKVKDVMGIGRRLIQDVGQKVSRLNWEVEQKKEEQALAYAEQDRLSDIRGKIRALKRLRNRKVVQPDENIVSILVEHGCLRQELYSIAKVSIPFHLKQYKPKLLNPETMGISADWLRDAMSVSELEPSDGFSRADFDAKLFTHGQPVHGFRKLFDLNDNEYMASDFSDWKVARRFIEHKLTLLQQELHPSAIPADAGQPAWED